MTFISRIKKLWILTISFLIAAVSICFPSTFQKVEAASQEIYSDPTYSLQSASALADSIINDGYQYLGTPYRFGAEYPSSGYFDCSSFTQWIFSKNGIELPRSSREQATVGKYVSPSELQKGDLLFTATSSSGGRIAHVGVYAGNGKLLHTYGPGGVRVDEIKGSWIEEAYVTARRILP